MSRFRWKVLPLAPAASCHAPGLVPLIIQLLFNRGLTSPSQLDLFFNSDRRLINDPFLLPDMHQAVGRLYRALLSGDKIIVYGDFDCDGITSTALLVQGLSALGGYAVPYIPHRLTEGYGLKTAALENLYRDGAGLVITCDCGVTALPEVKHARRMGLDVIITDHHLPLEVLPPAVAVVNPKRNDSIYPFPELAGVGVAFKLLQALYTSLGITEGLDNLLDLVALGTVADMVSLQGENRYLVQQGLSRLNNSPRLGISQLLECAGQTGATIDAEKISWIIAPRLNTPGRLEHAMASYQLLMSQSTGEINEISVWLEQKNAERQKLTTEAQGKARAQVLAAGLTPLLFAGDTSFPIGINGLVANRLAEEFYRPACVIHTGEVWSTGSCRSIPEFNIIQALNNCRHLLGQYGGHAQAAGFTVSNRHLPILKKSLQDMAAKELAVVDLRPHLDIDAEVNLAHLLTDNTYQLIQKLAPFGRGNPVPIFLSRGVTVLDCRTVGASGEHLRLKLKQNGCFWESMAFGMGNCLTDIKPQIDLVYNLEVDRWKGRETLRLNVLDIATG